MNKIDLATKNSLSPQCRKIVDYMERDGRITPDLAVQYLRVKSLSRRICDIQEAGIEVSRAMRKHPVTGERFAEYTLA